MRSIYGWSYPPGCSGTPYDEDDGVTELQEKVLLLLEASGIDTGTNDAIIKLIETAERKLENDHDPDLPNLSQSR